MALGNRQDMIVLLRLSQTCCLPLVQRKRTILVNLLSVCSNEGPGLGKKLEARESLAPLPMWWDQSAQTASLLHIKALLIQEKNSALRRAELRLGDALANKSDWIS